MRRGSPTPVTVDDWRLCAAAGLCAVDAAFLLRRSPDAAQRAARLHGIAFARHRGVRRALTRQERADYELALRKGLRRDEALGVAGRADLGRAR